MTVNSYLSGLASGAIIRDVEKESIRRSIATLQTRLRLEFSGDVSQHFVFGSYSRGTILPRYMDEQSDIDYMIVFRDGGFRPQTYLDRLQRFVRKYYVRSEIYQSNPTVVLSLNHIKFELVPGVSGFFGGLYIPAKASSHEDWMQTDPHGFNEALTEANSSNRNLIKPVIRLFKYWNAKNGYVYESFGLERTIAEKSYWHVGGLFGQGSLQDYFYDVVDNLQLGWRAPQWKRERLARLESVVDEARRHQSSGQEALAERAIRRALPPAGALTGLLSGTR